MHVFHVSCTCGATAVPFRSDAGFDAHMIRRVYCPTCVVHAPRTIMHCAVATGPHAGVYGVEVDFAALRSFAPTVPATLAGIRSLFQKGLLALGFFPKNRHAEVCVLLEQEGNAVKKTHRVVRRVSARSRTRLAV